MKKFLVGLGIAFLVIIVIFVAFGGFAFFQASKMMPSVQSFISDFYSQLDNQNYARIFNQLSDDKFRNSGSYENFEKMMQGLDQKLGKVKKTEKGAWKLNYLSDGTYFSIQYKTTREKADAVESFTLKKHGDNWRLVSYFVNSQALL